MGQGLFQDNPSHNPTALVPKVVSWRISRQLLHQAPNNPSNFSRPGLYILVFMGIPGPMGFPWGRRQAHFDAVVRKNETRFQNLDTGF